MTLAFLEAGCSIATATNLDPVCDGTRKARADHAAALAVSPDEAAVKTGTRLVALIDSGCAK